MSFNVHNVVGMNLESSDAKALEFFSKELASFKVNGSLSGPSVNLSWKPTSLPIFSPADGLYATHKLFARWRFSVEWEGSEVFITSSGTKPALPMVHHMLVQPAMRYLASEAGYLMLHGASLAYEGRSILITGPGGTGKTTVTSLLMEEGRDGWQFQSDDYTVLGPGPETLAFPARSHLYRDLLRWVPRIGTMLTPSERLGLLVFGVLRRWSRDKITWPVRIEIDRFWPNRSILPVADLAGIVLLTRGGSELRLEQADGTEGIIRDLILMNFDEARHFVHLMKRVGGIRSKETWLSDWRSRETRFLESRTQDTPFFRLTMPQWTSLENAPGQRLEEMLLPVLRGERM